MIPGPSEPDPQVLASLSAPILPHYGAGWGEVYQSTLEELKKIFKTKEQVIIFPGPGNGAVELVAANVIEPGDRVLNLVNGWFGEILGDVIRTYGGEPVNIKVEYGQVVTADDVESRLDRERTSRPSLQCTMKHQPAWRTRSGTSAEWQGSTV